MRQRQLLLVAASLLLPASAAMAQATSAPAPVFKSGVDLVRLDLRAVDDNGAPIRDLRADDIEIIEQGQRRPILLFQHIEEPPGTYADAAARTIGGEVSTNQGAPRGHLYVLLFDQDHITPGNEQRARMAAQTFIRTRLRPQDRVAVYGLPGPGPQLNFTSDAHRAISELDRVRGGLDRSENTALGTMTTYEAYRIAEGDSQMLARVSTRFASAGTDLAAVPLGPRAAQRTPNGETDQQLEQIVAENARTVISRAEGHARDFLMRAGDMMVELQRIEGRKSVVLFSEGFFVRNLQRDLERLAAAAAQSYSVVYAFDLNRRGDDLKADQPQGSDSTMEIQDRLEPLGSLASETGGDLLPAAISDVGRALNTLADASQDYYIVGFAPTTGQSAADYRRIQVRSKRRGVRVSTRTGYSRGPIQTDRRAAIDGALHAPYAQQGLQMRYTTYVLGGDSPGARKVVLSLEAELPVAAGPKAGTADVVFVVRRASDGGVATSGTDTMPLPAENAQGRSIGVGKYKVQFELPPGDYLMRAVVREPGGLVGTADRRFSVGSGQADISASDLILGRPGDPLPVRPQLYSNGVLSGMVELTARSSEQLRDVVVSLGLQPVGTDTHAVRTISGDPSPIREGPNGASRAVRFDLPMAGLPPGVYLARATVRSSGETAAEVLREVEVLSGDSPAEAPAATSVGVETRSASSVGVGAEMVNPANVLEGEIARELMTSVQLSGSDSALTDAAALALTGDWTHARTRLQQAQQPAGFEALALTGLCDFASRKYPDASAALDRAAAIKPDARVSFVLGWSREAAGDQRAAISAWRNAVVIDPKLLPAHLALAQVYEHMGETALAIQALRAGIAAVPDSPELHDRLARLTKVATRPPS